MGQFLRSLQDYVDAAVASRLSSIEPLRSDGGASDGSGIGGMPTGLDPAGGNGLRVETKARLDSALAAAFEAVERAPGGPDPIAAPERSAKVVDSSHRSEAVRDRSAPSSPFTIVADSPLADRRTPHPAMVSQNDSAKPAGGVEAGPRTSPGESRSTPSAGTPEGSAPARSNASVADPISPFAGMAPPPPLPPQALASDKPLRATAPTGVIQLPPVVPPTTSATPPPGERLSRAPRPPAFSAPSPTPPPIPASITFADWLRKSNGTDDTALRL
jgi:hypothetical protein